MDKEKVITLIIGLSVGLLLAGSYFVFSKRINFLGNTNTTRTIKPSTQPSPNNETVPNETLRVISPDDYYSTSDESITVSGTAYPKSKLVIFANAEEKIASVEADGKFNISVKLEEGENTIGIISIDGDKITASTKHVIRELKQ